MKRVIVFDLDGTLADTSGDLLAAANHCFADIDAQYPVLLKAYDAAIDHHTTLYPGVEQAVERIKSAGDAVAICTNKPEALAEKLMRSLGFRTPFDALIGADTLPLRKPDPAPYFEVVARSGGQVGRSLMIGDTLTDHNTARAANVPSVLVTFGPGGGDMAALEPDALLDHYDHLDATIARLLG